MKQQITKLAILVASVLLLSVTQAKEISGKAQDFTLPSRSGENVRLQELTGQVVLVNFWASWCGPCRKELPKLEELHQKYKDMGVTILGINIDENLELSQRLLKDVEVNFPVLYDFDNKVSKPYDISAMPSTFLIDKSGNFRYKHLGYLDGYEIKYENDIKELIRE
ncbi:MAG: TlpA family protein disulfide reductase [Enterobacterales bacterium]|nr:TlpA family protein disulfide reductase [Enterobacterales bacterium]